MLWHNTKFARLREACNREDDTSDETPVQARNKHAFRLLWDQPATPHPAPKDGWPFQWDKDVEKDNVEVDKLDTVHIQTKLGLCKRQRPRGKFQAENIHEAVHDMDLPKFVHQTLKSSPKDSVDVPVTIRVTRPQIDKDSELDDDDDVEMWCATSDGLEVPMNASDIVLTPTTAPSVGASRQSSPVSFQSEGVKGTVQGSPVVSRQSSLQGSPAVSRQSSQKTIGRASLGNKQSNPTSLVPPSSTSATNSRCNSPAVSHREMRLDRSPPRLERSPPRLERSSQAVRELAQVFLNPGSDSAMLRLAAQELLFESMPYDNVQNLKITPLSNARSWHAFQSKLTAEGGKVSRMRFTWHLAGSAAAASGIQAEGIRCSGEHCFCGRYGKGGYVATSAAKANAYADSGCEGGERHLFLVLAIPEREVRTGERGVRPQGTVADCAKYPTEYCFIDEARLHCVCRIDYQWVPTGRRTKVATAGDHCRAWRAHASPGASLLQIALALEGGEPKVEVSSEGRRMNSNREKKERCWQWRP